jgi:hypothetical protein
MRLEHMARVAIRYADEGWCTARNHHCDPERFDEHLVGDVVVDDATSALAFIVALDRTIWWSDAERARLDAFREVRRVLDAAIESTPTDELFRTLDADLQRAERHPGSDATLAALESDAGLRELVAAALTATRPAGREPRALLLELDPRWGEPETWRRLAKAIEVPPQVTELVYVYRNVVNGGALEFRELSREDLAEPCGDRALSRCLEPASLARIFRR